MEVKASEGHTRDTHKIREQTSSKLNYCNWFYFNTLIQYPILLGESYKGSDPDYDTGHVRKKMYIVYTRAVDLHQISFCNLKILNTYFQTNKNWEAIYVKTDVFIYLAYSTVQKLLNNFHSRRLAFITYK